MAESNNFLKLNAGTKAARSEDNGRVKTHILDYYDFGIENPRPKKKERGFFHPVCARLISPLRIDLKDKA